MKNMYLFFTSILLFSQVLPIVAMNSSEFSNNHSYIRDHSMQNYSLDEENSMMSSITEDTFGLSSFSNQHDQASINAMVIDLVSRANNQDEIIRQQKRQINYLNARVQENESTKELLIKIYKKFPAVVYEIEKTQNQLAESRMLQNQQEKKINNLRGLVDQYASEHTDVVSQLANVVAEHGNRHERHEVFSKKLHKSLCDQLENNQTRVKNELKVHAKNIKAFTSLDLNPVHTKKSSSNNQSSAHELYLDDQNFDFGLDADFNFDNLEEFSPSQKSNFSTNTSCANVSVDSGLSHLRPKRARDNSVDENLSKKKKN